MQALIGALVLCSLAAAAPNAAPTARPFIVRGLTAPPMADTLEWASHKLEALKRPMDGDRAADYNVFFGGFKTFMPEDEADHFADLYKRDRVAPVPRQPFDMGVVKREEEERRRLSKRQAAQSAGISVNDYFRAGLDSQYSGPLSVGTPAQVLPVLFDLGSAAIYVPTASCRTVLCSNQAKFDASASSTFVNTSQRAASLYQQGGALGYIVRETVGLGPYQTQDFTMLAAVYVTNGDLKSSNPDANQQPSLTGTGAGILGLSYSAFTVSSGATANVSLTRVTDASVFVRQTLVGSLVAGNKLPSNIMGLFLQRALDSSVPTSRLSASGGVLVGGSELCIGCIDSTRYTGQLNYVPLASQVGYWIVQSGGISVGGQVIPGSTGLNVVFDSGFTLMPFPTTVVASIASALGAQRATQLDKSVGGNAYAIACNTDLTLSMTFGGVSYPIDSRDLIFPVLTSTSGQTICALTIYGTNALPTGVAGIAGMPALKSIYTVYNYDQGGSIGMAPAIRNTAATLATVSSNAGSASDASRGISAGTRSLGLSLAAAGAAVAAAAALRAIVA